MNQTMTKQSWMILLAVSIIWALSFLLVELALVEVPPFSIMAARVTIGAAGLYLMVKVTGGSTSGATVAENNVPSGSVSWRHLWTAFFVLGLLNNVVPFSLLVWSQTELSASVASILNATMPLFVVFLAHFFTVDERATLPKVLGVSIGVIGVALIVGGDGFDLATGGTLGKFAVLGAACSYAVAALVGRHFSRLGLPPLTLAWGQSTGAALIALPIVSIFDQPWTLAISMQTWVVLLVLGLLCSSVAYALYFRLIAVAGATNASLVTLTIPPFAILLGVLFLGESLSVHHMLGMVAIFAGLLVIDGRLQRRRTVT
ncbi:DMT family transporter [Kordiimonas aquimaris]|uniref:DMT family transporter n=1 Tax=Kordiimonas aquimaris TaxID=707591 RepID=UPI0021D121B5|nr:DMT family transporter [Kordiimonas aquimaris]